MKKSIFLDTNIIIDILETRENYELTVDFLGSVKKENLFISAITIPNCIYISKIKLKDIPKFREQIYKYSIVDLTKQVIEQAFSLNFKDFEDAIQLASCAKVDGILITWNKKDFKKGTHLADIYTPKEYLKKFS